MLHIQPLGIVISNFLVRDCELYHSKPKVSMLSFKMEMVDHTFILTVHNQID